jgi:hypothetical protein
MTATRNVTSGSIIRFLQKGINGTVACGPLHALLFLPTGNILKGFGIDRSQSKGRFYVWRVITPLYRPADHLIFDYSIRICDGKAFESANRSLEEVGGQVLSAIIDRRHHEYLSNIRTEADFLEIIEKSQASRSNNIKRLADLAVTNYKLGQALKCRELLEIAVALPCHWGWQSEMRLDLFEALQQYDTKREVWETLIRRWEGKTRTALADRCKIPGLFNAAESAYTDVRSF